MTKMSGHVKQIAQREMRDAATAALAKSQELAADATKYEAAGRKDLAASLREAAAKEYKASEYYDEAAGALDTGDFDDYYVKKSWADQTLENAHAQESSIHLPDPGTEYDPPAPVPQAPTTPMALPDDPSVAAAAHARREAARRAAERDRPEMSTEKEVELSVDDAEQARTSATMARVQAQLSYETEATRITTSRDHAAREQWTQEQSAKAAQMQVKREQKVVDEARAKYQKLQKDAEAANNAGDGHRSEYLLEQAGRVSADQHVAEARLEAAQAEEARGLAASAAAKAQVDQWETEYSELQTRRDEAEKAVDGLEERANLLEEAKMKLQLAEMTGDDKYRQEAQALVEKAEKVHVDMAAVDPAPTDASATPVGPPGSAGSTDVGMTPPVDPDVLGVDDGSGAPADVAAASQANEPAEPAATASGVEEDAALDDAPEPETAFEPVAAEAPEFTAEPEAAYAAAPVEESAGYEEPAESSDESYN